MIVEKSHFYEIPDEGNFRRCKPGASQPRGLFFCIKCLDTVSDAGYCVTWLVGWYPQLLGLAMGIVRVAQLGLSWRSPCHF